MRGTKKIKLAISIVYKLFVKAIGNSISGIKSIPVHTKEFGLKIALLKYIDNLLLFNKRIWYINAITKYMDSELFETFGNFPMDNEEKLFDFDGKIPIWMCWWQGITETPNIVNVCVNRVKGCLSDKYKLVLIDKNNCSVYTSIPEFVIQKNQNGKMCLAHMCDILRVKLLAIYGGVWIDATCYLSNPNMLKVASQSAFFSPKLTETKIVSHESSRGKWCTFFLAGNSSYFCYIYNALLCYWKKHDIAVDYTLLDYVMYVGYKNIDDFRQLVDSTTESCNHVWDLLVHINDIYDENEFQSVLSKSGVFKLSHREKLEAKTSEGKITVYGKLLMRAGN